MNFYGLIGEKLSHSLSPEIHEYIFKSMGIEAHYKLFEVKNKDIKDLGKALKVLSIKGVNVTIPYKEEIISQLDELSEEAKNIGAVNTILNVDERLIGYNTDYYGFKYMLLNKDILVKDKKVVVLGNGGASKAVIQYLLDDEAKEIFLVSRNIENSNYKKDGVKLIDYKQLENIDGDIIINTTPVGMYPNIGKSPVSKDIINKYDVLVDLIYNPLETEFIKIGNKLGKKTCQGLMMLVCQGVKADEIWEGVKVSEDTIKNLYNILSKKFI